MSQPPIRPGRKVLLIGDSHTVLRYGTHLDEQCRATGAIVRTYGSCSSHPLWWFEGSYTHCGYLARDEQGREINIPFGRFMATPKIDSLLELFWPDVVIVSLGANLIDLCEEDTVSTCRKMARMIQSYTDEVFWVGPPNIRLHPPKKLARLYKFLEHAVSSHVQAFIDSRPMTHYMARGGDGIHFTGKTGQAIAENWAKQVFAAIQG